MKIRKSFESRVFELISLYHEQNPTSNKRDIDRIKEFIKSSDFTLRRQKDSILEDAIVVALRQIQLAENEQISSEDSDSEFNESVKLMHVVDRNSMNRLLTKTYSSNASKTEIHEKNDPKEKSLKRPISVNKSSTIKKKVKQDDVFMPSNSRYSDLGGISDCIEEIRELVEVPLTHPEIYNHLNLKPPRGILLHGPPGCGKTKLAEAISGELNMPLINVSSPSVVSGMSGESEKKIRELFEQAKSNAPCILFFDEIDAITPKRDNVSKDMERRIVAQLLTCMDDLASASTPLIVIGATNRPDALDPALRRAGRFDREISLGIPNEKAREEILRIITKDLRLEAEFDFTNIAKCTPGYVGADLHALASTAGVIALKRIFSQLVDPMITEHVDLAPMERFLKSHPQPLNESEMENLYLKMEDFTAALKKVQPSSKREGFATVPDVSWSEIGALAAVREELKMSIVEPIKNPDVFARAGISSPSGILLWGPPGNGKTLLAKAVANETHCNFISVKGPELLNKYVGESERGVRQLFARARASSPCVIFFDELDALCPKRGGNSDSSTSERVVNQLLTELDGLEGRKDVYIVAATNRPDIIDRAMLRPGRFDKLVYVKLPEPEERVEILKTLTVKVPLAADVDLVPIAKDVRCSRFSGADLFALVKEAGMVALKEYFDRCTETKDLVIEQRHLDRALSRVTPSVSENDLKEYEIILRNM